MGRKTKNNLETSAYPSESFADYNLKMDKYNLDTEIPFHSFPSPIPHTNLEQNYNEKPTTNPQLEHETPTNTPNFCPTPIANPKPTPLKTHGFTVSMPLKQQHEISSGKKKIQARIDLHKLTQSQAYETVSNFIIQSYHRNHRMLLIITGKGSRILQNSLPKWLENSTLHHKILYHDYAKPSDGGEGARYVYLRKKTDVTK